MCFLKCSLTTPVKTVMSVFHTVKQERNEERVKGVAINTLHVYMRK